MRNAVRSGAPVPGATLRALQLPRDPHEGRGPGRVTLSLGPKDPGGVSE